MNKPVLLLETRTDPMVFLTSRSLTIETVRSGEELLEFCYDSPKFNNLNCYGQNYIILGRPKNSLTITARLGEETYDYNFTF